MHDSTNQFILPMLSKNPSIYTSNKIKSTGKVLCFRSCEPERDLKQIKISKISNKLGRLLNQTIM